MGIGWVQTFTKIHKPEMLSQVQQLLCLWTLGLQCGGLLECGRADWTPSKVKGFQDTTAVSLESAQMKNWMCEKDDSSA